MQNQIFADYLNNLKPIVLLVSRHPETEGNINHKIYRHIPEPHIQITDKGREQAELAAQYFLKIIEKIEQGKFNDIPQYANIDLSGYDGECKVLIHRSPYPRLDYYTECVQKALGSRVIGVTADPRLGEISWGNMEGMTVKEAKKKFPLNFARNSKYKRHSKSAHSAAPPETDTKQNFLQIICSFLVDLFTLRLFKNKLSFQHVDHFHHRFPDGESPMTVVQRVASYKDTVVWQNLFAGKPVVNIFLTHDYISRAITMVHCQKGEAWFNDENSPDNCSIRILEEKKWMKGTDYGYLNPTDLGA